MKRLRRKKKKEQNDKGTNDKPERMKESVWGGNLSVKYMTVTAAAKSKMLLDYMVSCIICILFPAQCLSFS